MIMAPECIPRRSQWIKKLVALKNDRPGLPDFVAFVQYASWSVDQFRRHLRERRRQRTVFQRLAARRVALQRAFLDTL